MFYGCFKAGAFRFVNIASIVLPENADLIAYYKERAAEYEKIYTKPERQPDLQRAAQILQQTFEGKAVYEIACGTGYWTQRIAKTASSILATDINPSVIEIAKSKMYAPATVAFEIADIFNLNNVRQHDNLFGGFVWSHIPLQELDAFLDTVGGQVVPGGIMAFMDNNYVAGSNLPISRMDAYGNMYQNRHLENGSTYEVLKNFPSKEFIKDKLLSKYTAINIMQLQYFWIAICKKPVRP